MPKEPGGMMRVLTRGQRKSVQSGPLKVNFSPSAAGNAEVFSDDQEIGISYGLTRMIHGWRPQRREEACCLLFLFPSAIRVSSVSSVAGKTFSRCSFAWVVAGLVVLAGRDLAAPKIPSPSADMAPRDVLRRMIEPVVDLFANDPPGNARAFRCNCGCSKPPTSRRNCAARACIFIASRRTSCSSSFFRWEP